MKKIVFLCSCGRQIPAKRVEIIGSKICIACQKEAEQKEAAELEKKRNQGQVITNVPNWTAFWQVTGNQTC